MTADVGGTASDRATDRDRRFDDSRVLDADGLKGARIGVANAFFGEDRRVVRILEQTHQR